MMYTKSFVLYADILGFSDLIEKRSADDISNILSNFGLPFDSIVLDSLVSNTSKKYSLDNIRRLKKIYRKDDVDFDENVQLIDKANGKRRCTIFSDNVVSSLKLDTNNDNFYENISNELRRIIEIIQLLIQRDILFRGGIAVGDIHHTEKMVFGPALITAYKIESKSSIYPRICIDNEICMAIESLEFEKYPYKDDMQNCISKDFDGMYFIDYLKCNIANWYSYHKQEGNNTYNDLVLDQFLIRHKEYIQNNHPNDPSTPYYQKIAWLENYHNNKIRSNGNKFKEFGLNINDYLIIENT